MSGIGFRPKGVSSPMYNPERDYAYITPTLMRAAIENLDSDDVEIRAWRAEHGISDTAIAAAATALAEAQRDFVNATDPVASFDLALARRNFASLPFSTRQFLFASVGYVFCAAWFQAVREVSIVCEESPAAGDMAKFAASVAAFAQKSIHEPIPCEETVETLKFKNDVFAARVATLLAQLEVCQDAQRLAELKIQSLQTEKSTPLWTRIFSACQSFFRRK